MEYWVKRLWAEIPEYKKVSLVDEVRSKNPELLKLLFNEDQKNNLAKQHPKYEVKMFVGIRPLQPKSVEIEVEDLKIEGLPKHQWVFCLLPPQSTTSQYHLAVGAATGPVEIETSRADLDMLVHPDDYILNLYIHKGWTLLLCQDKAPVMFDPIGDRHRGKNKFRGKWKVANREYLNASRNACIWKDELYFIDLEDRLVKMELHEPFKESVVGVPHATQSGRLEDIFIDSENFLLLFKYGELRENFRGQSIQLFGSECYTRVAYTAFQDFFLVTGWSPNQQPPEAAAYLIHLPSLTLLQTVHLPCEIENSPPMHVTTHEMLPFHFVIIARYNKVVDILYQPSGKCLLLLHSSEVTQGITWTGIHSVLSTHKRLLVAVFGGVREVKINLLVS